MARNTEAEQVLYWIAVGLDAWGGDLLSRSEDAWWAKRIDDARNAPPAYEYTHFGIPYDPTEWREIDEEPPLSPTDRKAFSRAVEALEEAGLVTVVRRHGKRATHLRPTPKGLTIACRMETGVDLRLVKKAMRTVQWATPAHIRAIDAAAKETKSSKSRKNLKPRQNAAKEP